MLFCLAIYQFWMLGRSDQEEVMTENQMKRHIEYYFKFKELRNLHRELKFGENPPIPEVFSQNICKLLFGLSDWYDRKADAKDEQGKAIEIKATGTKSGTTSIDIKAIRELGDQFAGVYWLYFDFDSDEIVINFLPKIRFKNVETSTKPRENIRLSKYVGFNCKTHTFKISRENVLITKSTLT